MSFLSRLLGTEPDPKEQLRPLWHRVIELAREKHWYLSGGVRDSLEGRFDMITAVLAVALLRMEQEEELIAPSVRLTELFVEDMDGQMRQSGVGDLVVGKHMGKLVSTMGGRLGAYRTGLAEGQNALIEAVRRNATLADGHDGAVIARGLRSLADRFARTDGAALLAGEIAA
ncbi:MAG: ubiquinol-cytochrome C chaperone family protein [Sphingomonadaceae bacterium]|nr:ubiquinol-cytochrome C chaperone family protein [Sphingomonadaceae bacterium]